jgi:hypothetical protein
MSTAGSGSQDLLDFIPLRLTVARLRLRITPEFPAPRVDHLRAAIASARPELDLLHQHGTEGLIYRYPRVLYRVDHHGPTILAVGEGIDVLSALTLVGVNLRLGATVRHVMDATLDVTEHDLGPIQSSRTYRLTTPWLALNQENHARFGRLDEVERSRFLDAQVVNNCLSLAKSFGLRVTSRLVGHAHVRPISVRMKDVEMTGFLGKIIVNFSIPEGLGLGKSVSKGFGAVRGVD